MRRTGSLQGAFRVEAWWTRARTLLASGLLAAALAGCAAGGPGLLPRGAGDSYFSTVAEPRQVPDFRFVDAAGREASLAEFRGRPVLLNLWAPWCPPCRSEMRALDALAGRRNGIGVEVLAVSLDRGGVGTEGFKDLKAYAAPAGRAARAFGPGGIPTTLLIDAEGREIARALGPRPWDRPSATAEILRRLGRGDD